MPLMYNLPKPEKAFGNTFLHFFTTIRRQIMQIYLQITVSLFAFGMKIESVRKQHLFFSIGLLSYIIEKYL